MKKILFLLLTIPCLQVFSQAPPQMNYQAVVRDNSGAAVPNNTPVVLRFTIHDGSATGTAVFTETQPSTNTNQFGLVNVQIGSTASLTGVNWGSGAKYLHVEANVNGGGFNSMGTSQLVSVPYALNAGSGYWSANGNNIQNANSGSVDIGTYLKVGNPSTPSSAISGSKIPLYKLSYLSGTEAWTVGNDCGGTEWYVNITGINSGLLYFDNSGTNHRTSTYSPWIWVPSGSNNLLVEGTYYCSLEDNYDGVFLEYMTGGGSWTSITAFDYGGYPDNAVGSNTACNGGVSQPCWNGINDTKFFRVTPSTFLSSAYGNWIRFRYVGMEDASGNTGEFDVKGFNVTVNPGPAVGGSFATGNIYAEKNVYAGSNVLLGDVAEYFNVESETRPGDLIGISSEKADSYIISSQAFNPYILGIHSTNPTVTLNAPKGTPVCLTGRVPVNVCSENGSIKIGDYLTSASIKGYAMKADRPCYAVARALENFDANGTGQILCMVQTGWYNPNTNTSTQTGESFFVLKNNSEAIVNDASIKSSSRIFVTLRENAGAHWISKVADGTFTLNIEKAKGKNIPFDYFVDNANAAVPVLSKAVTQVKELSASDTNSNTGELQLQTYSDIAPPGSPPDVKSAWTWSANTGFVKTYDAQKGSK